MHKECMPRNRFMLRNPARTDLGFGVAGGSWRAWERECLARPTCGAEGCKTRREVRAGGPRSLGRYVARPAWSRRFPLLRIPETDARVEVAHRSNGRAPGWTSGVLRATPNPYMRRRLLLPLLGFVVAITVATVGAWSTEADGGGPAHFASPECPLPGQATHLRRLADARNGASATSSLPLIVPPATVAAPTLLDPAARVQSRARPLPGGRIVCAGRTSRGPPLA